MRTWIVGSLALVLTVGVLPVQAAETLTLYDNFNLSTIDHTKWIGSSQDTLETYRFVTFPVAGDGELRLIARGWAMRTLDPTGQGEGRSATNRLAFRRLNQEAVRAIKATVRVDSATATDCTAGTAEPTQARFRMSGYFFNDGTGEPGRATGDVYARLEVIRLSTNTVANQLNVRAKVGRCLEPECVREQGLFNQVLANILVGQTHTLLLQWDPTANQFLFQLDANPVASYTYPVSDPRRPQNAWDQKYIGINHYIPNCKSNAVSAYMSVYVDDVFVNSAAVSAP